MQPNLIRATANSSLDLLAMRGRGSPEAFLLAWVAWEGLKIRILVVALTQQGWKVQDVYDELSSSRLHTLEHYRTLFKSIFGTYPESTRGVGATWCSIEEFRDVRNRYVHGTRGAAPLRLEAGTHLITGHVLDPSWLERLALDVDGDRVNLGAPYRRLTSTRRMTRSKRALRELLSQAMVRKVTGSTSGGGQ